MLITISQFHAIELITYTRLIQNNSKCHLQSEGYVIKCVVNVNRFQFIIILSCILFGYLKPCNE